MSLDSPEEIPHMLQALGEGQETAYDHFFRKYYRALCLFANSYMYDLELSKDIVQECFTILWEKRLSLIESKGIQSFLYTVVRNKCIEKQRRSSVHNKRKEQYDYLAAVWGQEEINEVVRAELLRKIYAEISILPPKMQKVFTMSYVEGKNLKEIAQELNTSYENVQKHRARALAILKGRLLTLFALISALKNLP